ncbi:hypothetical protein EDD22DRAFT_847315 [Suillus occidentalis]|nr:hypothetical protein EDD22DRAFT_847315 [Suillus occidentalis]
MRTKRAGLLYSGITYSRNLETSCKTVITTGPRFEDEDGENFFWDHYSLLLASIVSSRLDPFMIGSEAVQGCKANAQLRVFTLGLVNMSHLTCVSALLVKAEANVFSGSPPAVNYSPSNHHHTLPLPPSVVQLEPSPSMQQAPPTIKSLFPPWNTPQLRLLAKLRDLEEVLEDGMSAPASDEDIKKAEAAIIRKLGLDYQLRVALIRILDGLTLGPRPSSPVPHPEDPIQRVQSPVFDAAPSGTIHPEPPSIQVAAPVAKEAFTIIPLL